MKNKKNQDTQHRKYTEPMQNFNTPTHSESTCEASERELVHPMDFFDPPTHVDGARKAPVRELVEPMEFFGPPAHADNPCKPSERELVEPMIFLWQEHPIEEKHDLLKQNGPCAPSPETPPSPTPTSTPATQKEDDFCPPTPEIDHDAGESSVTSVPESYTGTPPALPGRPAFLPPAPPPLAQMDNPSIPPHNLSLSERFNQFIVPPASPTTSSPLSTSIRARGGIKPTPYELMEKIKHTFTLRVLGKDIYYYTGSYYEKTDQQKMHCLIMDVCRKEIQLHGSGVPVKKAYDLLLMEPEVAVTELTLNRNFVPFQNGLLRLDNGLLLPHSSEVFTTYVLNCNYWPSTHLVCPQFDRYLYTVTGGDTVLTTRIWEMIGYCLTPDTSGKVLFVLQGVPNSGKSLLSDLMRSFFPADKVSAQDVHDLGKKFHMGELKDRALNISPDLSAEVLDNASVSNIKKLTGNDMVAADRKYASFQQYQFEGKLILATNYPLLTKAQDEAFVQRIVTIPFLFAVSPERRDPHLLDKLKQERDAIATKALAYYFQLRQRGYQFSGHYPINSEAILMATNLLPNVI